MLSLSRVVLIRSVHTHTHTHTHTQTHTHTDTHTHTQSQPILIYKSSQPLENGIIFLSHSFFIIAMKIIILKVSVWSERKNKIAWIFKLFRVI